MNQINKILSGLKKRRVTAPAGDASPAETAPPPAVRSKIFQHKVFQNRVVLFAVLGFLVLSAAGGLWLWLYKTPAAPVKTAQAPAKPISAPKPAAPPPVIEQAEADKEKAVEAVAAASQPAAEVVQAESAVTAAKQEDVAAKAVKEVAPHEQPAEKAEVQSVASREAVPAEGGSKPEQERKAVVDTAKSGREVQASMPAKAKPADAGKKRRMAVASPKQEMEEVASESESTFAGGGVDKQVKPLSAEEQANNEFIKASGLAQRGDIKEALAGYETVLHLEPGHEAARQAMVVLLLQGKRNVDAERVLQDGLKQNIKNSGFAMLLARIQLDRDAPWSALLTLQKTLPYAAQQADYQAFVAALLQRLNRHKEAVVHYQIALELAPDSGVWWMGMGISLKALQQTEDARTAFKRALQSNTLSADLRDFVTRQLRDM